MRWFQLTCCQAACSARCRWRRPVAVPIALVNFRDSSDQISKLKIVFAIARYERDSYGVEVFLVGFDSMRLSSVSFPPILILVASPLFAALVLLTFVFLLVVSS